MNYFYEAMKTAPDPEGCAEIFHVEDFGTTLDEYSVQVRCCGSDGYLCLDCQPEDEDAKFWREMARSSDEEHQECPYLE